MKLVKDYIHGFSWKMIKSDMIYAYSNAYLDIRSRVTDAVRKSIRTAPIAEEIRANHKTR